MRKLGPLIAIISGLVLAVFAGLSMMVATGNATDIAWLGKFTESATSSVPGNTAASTLYGILIGFGVIEMILGLFAWNNSRGLSALILFGLVITSMVFSIITGVKAHHFPIATIIMISVQGIASLGMLSGFLNKA